MKQFGQSETYTNLLVRQETGKGKSKRQGVD
jgi:hypothetical protein